VGAYNSTIGYLNTQFSYNPADDKTGNGPPPLNGDSAARQVQQRLKSFVTGRMQGLTGRERSAISELGVTSDEKTGLLSLDTTKLEDALEQRPDVGRADLLTRFGEAMDGAKFSFARRSAKSQTRRIRGQRHLSPRTRAEVTSSAARSCSPKTRPCRSTTRTIGTTSPRTVPISRSR
jgi:hypothetical protein